MNISISESFPLKVYPFELNIHITIITQFDKYMTNITDNKYGEKVPLKERGLTLSSLVLPPFSKKDHSSSYTMLPAWYINPFSNRINLNPGPAEPCYNLPLQTV